MPLSFEVLEQRLRGRADSISETEIAERLAKAVEHLQKTERYHDDAYNVNDTLNRVTSLIEEDF